MAKLTRKILGNVNGAVGDITFANWKGRTVIKAKSEGSKADPTVAQLLVREKFKVLTELSNAFVQVIPLGLESAAITAYNLFRRLNFPAIEGTLGALTVDHAIILVSRGNLATLNGLGFAAAGLNINATWNFGDYGDATDTITLVVYCPDLKKTVVTTGALRSSGTIAISVPAAWATKEVHAYIYSGNDETKSTSQYLGSLTI
ncbi:MAG: hypothetical protein IPL26_07175 [Leptospiraceae bacterium]|nr:hypothetical protein [Leptospiraceae bacterium]